LLGLLYLYFSALGRFCDAVSDYLANIDHAPDPTVKKEAFSSEINIAYDVLASTWIHIREPKVLNNTVECYQYLRNLYLDKSKLNVGSCCCRCVQNLAVLLISKAVPVMVELLLRYSVLDKWRRFWMKRNVMVF
jgi:hypothetical protein